MKTQQIYSTTAAVLILGLLHGSTLWALSPEDASFRPLVERVEAKCPDMDCPQDRLHLLPVNGEEFAQTHAQQMSQMTSLVKDIASDEWPDSILEANFYVQEINPQIVKIDLVFDKVTQQTVGYRLIYSNKAWSLDNCNFDPRKPDTLQSCQAGNFLEIAFATMDLKVSFRDPKTMVEFDPSPTN